MSEQIGLFDAMTPPSKGHPISMPDGEVVYFEHFFSPAESSDLFSRLSSETNWRQEKIRFYGRDVAIPRLTAWFGDPGKSYTYSGIAMKPTPWTPVLLAIKDKIERVAAVRFNSVLLNLYRTGKDGVSWHSDDEPELGREPVIGSVSLGSSRVFQMRHLMRKDLERIDLPLTDGSLLIMRGETQKYWQHQIPKTKKVSDPRINLTFRMIC